MFTKSLKSSYLFQSNGFILYILFIIMNEVKNLLKKEFLYLNIQKKIKRQDDFSLSYFKRRYSS